MTDLGRQNFERSTGTDAAGQADYSAPAAAAAGGHDNARLPIGVVLEISGSGSQIALDLQRLNECMEDADPSIALAG
ncbi:MAG: ATPase, partial [Erythrobacter sp.]|nr:ATPase [Erythrobacter sp.]